jgi:hypothetical protein
MISFFRWRILTTKSWGNLGIYSEWIVAVVEMCYSCL